MNRNKKVSLAGKLHLVISLLCMPVALSAATALHYEMISRLSMWSIFLACLLVSRIEFKKFQKALMRHRALDGE